jgi:hypothetical protein
MPHVGCNPDARCHTGERKNESNLEAPKKVIVIKWAKKRYTEENKIQKLRVESFQPLRRVICQILKRQMSARNQITNSSARMFQCVRRPSPKKISHGQRIRCSLCCAKKSANPRVPAAIFSKSGAVPSHSSQNGVSTPIPEYEKTD